MIIEDFAFLHIDDFDTTTLLVSSGGIDGVLTVTGESSESIEKWTKKTFNYTFNVDMLAVAPIFGRGLPKLTVLHDY
jgi:hypothetical protein